MTDAQLRSFLLRRLPPAETARLEEAILLEDGFAERLRDEEFDLLDDYAASRLDEVDRVAVERHLLGTEGNLHSLRIARALRRQRAPADILRPQSGGSEVVPNQGDLAAGRSRQETRARRNTQRVAQAAAVLAACVVALAVIPQWHRDALRPSSAAGASGAADSGTPARGATGSAAPASGAADRSTPATAPAFVARGESSSTASPPDPLPIITLVADVDRGGATPALQIPHGASSIRLQTEVPGSARDMLYGVRINDAAGQRVFEASALAIHAAGPYRFVEAEVPAAALGPGDRTISVIASGAAEGTATKFSWHVTGVLH